MFLYNGMRHAFAFYGIPRKQFVCSSGSHCHPSDEYPMVAYGYLLWAEHVA